MSSTSKDSLSEAEQALWAAIKSLADALWHIENQPQSFSEGSTTANDLGSAVGRDFDNLEAAVRALPDYSTLVGDKATYDARVAAVNEKRALVLPQLRQALVRKEQRLAEVKMMLQSVSRELAGLDVGPS